jgi:hypothetical protein
LESLGRELPPCREMRPFAGFLRPFATVFAAIRGYLRGCRDGSRAALPRRPRARAALNGFTMAKTL